MKVKTTNLIGPALDWAVAKCESEDGDYHRWNGERIYLKGALFHPSTSWSQGGPIIERERIRVEPFVGAWLACVWYEDNGEYHLFYRGPTPLIAAMRCFVASKLGEFVDIPEELLK